MALGSPSINTPNALDLRAIQTAISNTRSRIEQLEKLAASVSSTSTTTSSVSLVAVLAQIAALKLQIAALGDLESMIEALPFSSGVTSEAEVPVVMGGVAVRVTAGDIARLAAAGVDLGMLIDALPFSSGVDQHGQIPFTIAGVALRANAADIARLIFTAPFNSGVDANALVPVEIGGIIVLVTAGDIARLGGGAVNLGTLIAALPFSSGVDAHFQVPVEIGGVAVRVDARDIAALASVDLETLIAALPHQSGADPLGFVPVSLGGVAVQMQIGDIVALAGGLPSIANNTLLANITGGAAVPVSTALSALLDAVLGSSQGNIITRNGAVWTVLSPGPSGYVIASGGPGANVGYVAAPGLSGTTKVVETAVSLGTQAGSQSAFTYTTVPLVCARGFVSQFLVTASHAGQFDLVVRGAGADSGTLFLQALYVTGLTYLMTLVWYYENDAAGQDFFIGWRNTGASSVALTLTSLRLERVA